MPAPRKKTATDLHKVAHEICWAKTLSDGSPGISVRDHCLNVGCVAEALLELLPAQLKALVPPGVATLAALHDVGKVSPGFQVKSEKWVVRYRQAEHALNEGWRFHESDHAKISQFTTQELLGESRLHLWAAALGAHHGKVKGERVLPCEPWWEDERRRLSLDLVKVFGPLPDQPAAKEATVWVVAGLITISDWIASDERLFLLDAGWTIAERREKARTALQTIGWKSPVLRKGLCFGDLFPSTPQANNLQVATSRAVRQPAVYIIEGPMGCGKTEAALEAAYQLMQAEKATGFYFALPTQVTSNRIYLRVQKFITQIGSVPGELRLAHSASWLVDTEPPLHLNPASRHDAEAESHVRVGRSWFASAKRALLTPFGVGTIDQALLGIVAANHFFLRQFGLAGKVVVLDEVHTYDLYTSTLIDTLVRRLRDLQCTVIVLSATLTEKRRRELLGLRDDQLVSVAYPLVSSSNGQLAEWPCDPPTAITIHVRCLSGEGLVDESLERARRGQCVLWIRNTVDEAQETHRVLKGASIEGDPAIALLHSRFPFFRRQELEAEWMERLGKDSARRPAGCVLVSTQVAEQSVDIDADLLITDLAPTDMLLQRLGRLWRHDRPNRPSARPEVWIQVPPLNGEAMRTASGQELRDVLGKSARVYAPYLLLRSLEQWRKRTAITLPDDIRQILEATYADVTQEQPEAWKQLRQQLEQQKDKMTILAERCTKIWAEPALDDEEGVQTRYGTYPMAQLLLIREMVRVDRYSMSLKLLSGETAVAEDRGWNLDTAKAIHRNLVPVPRWAIAAQLQNQPGWLSNYAHQPTAIGLLQDDGSIRGHDGQTHLGLCYHPEQGVIIDPKRIPRVAEEDDEYYD